jgi:hypothetical protein
VDVDDDDDDVHEQNEIRQAAAEQLANNESGTPNNRIKEEVPNHSRRSVIDTTHRMNALELAVNEREHYNRQMRLLSPKHEGKQWQKHFEI